MLVTDERTAAFFLGTVAVAAGIWVPRSPVMLAVVGVVAGCLGLYVLRDASPSSSVRVARWVNGIGLALVAGWGLLAGGCYTILPCG